MRKVKGFCSYWMFYGPLCAIVWGTGFLIVLGDLFLGWIMICFPHTNNKQLSGVHTFPRPLCHRDMNRLMPFHDVPQTSADLMLTPWLAQC